MPLWSIARHGISLQRRSEDRSRNIDPLPPMSLRVGPLERVITWPASPALARWSDKGALATNSLNARYFASYAGEVSAARQFESCIEFCGRQGYKA